jgi:hypothetical protein
MGTIEFAALSDAEAIARDDAIRREQERLYKKARVPVPTADFGNAAGPHNFDPLPPPSSAFHDEIANRQVADDAMAVEKPWASAEPPSMWSRSNRR